MKIIDILTKRTEFKIKKVFRVTYAARSYAYGVYIKIVTDEGIFGLGESMPNPYVTGETVDSVICAIEYMKENLIGLDPTDIEGIHNVMDKLLVRNTAAKAGIDLACYDIIGKKLNLPVYKVLGGKDNEIVTDITIGIDKPEEMAKDARENIEKGFRYLKIKGGINKDEDLLAIKLIREAVGDSVELRSDFNQGYRMDNVMEVLEAIKEYNVLEAEQPLPAWDVVSMSELRKISPVPIMIDEGAKTPEEVITACRLNACDVVNIKLMKCGGIYPALKISDIAKSYGKKCIVGCMTESKLGICAGASVVSAKKDNMLVPDLDGYFSFDDTPVSVSGGMELKRDTLVLSDKAGFGFDEYDF